MSLPRTPDVELSAIKWLQTALSVLVSDQRPSELPERFVIVERAGGPEPSDIVIFHPRLAVQVWGVEKGDAFRLAAAVQNSFTEWEGRGVLAVRPAEPVFFPDSETERPRYIFTVSLDVMGDFS